MNSPAMILHLEDDACDAELVAGKLQQSGLAYDLRLASGRKEFEAALDEMRFDLILSDYNLPDYDGMAALALAREKQPHVPFIMISGQLGEEKALECIRCGATDYVLKQKLDWLVPAVVRTLAEAEDRQKRREAEADLRKSARQTNAMFEQAAVGIAMVGLDGQWLRVNRRLCEMVGYSEDELLRLRFQDLTHPDDVAADVDAIRAMVSGELTNYAREKRYLRKDEATFWVNLSMGLVKNEDGHPDYFVSVFEDIAERKRAETELRESKQLVEAVVENVPLMVFLKEAKDLRFVVFNKAGEELLGYDRKDLLGKNNLDLFPPEQAAHFMAKDREVLTEGVLLDIPEEPIQTAKKGTRLLHTRKACIKGPDGVTKYLLGISEDITEQKKAEAERKNLEEQLRMSQKMEAIGSLAGGVAHDFNNLLSVILSYTGFATGALPDGDPMKDDLLEVKKAADRAVALTRQLLAFGRKQVLQPVPLDLNQISLGVEKMLRRILGEDVDFVQVLSPDLGLTLADPGQIEQVMMNLVVNARDAMPEGGKLTIETSNVEIDEEYAARHVAVKPGSYVQIAVTDTGSGMDAQTQARIFEPFFTTKEKGKGTGLGLSTVYGIVKQSGGSVWVYSELGQGTTFKVYFPRELSATTATVIKPSTVPRGSTGTETILVVEDEEALRKVAKRSLEAAGYRVLIAVDGDDALLTSAQHAGDIHLLLTDVVMPRMSGRVLAQEFAKARPTVKVLYMSGYTDNAIVHHGVLDKGTHFLAKPFTSAVLTQKVREVLDIGATKLADGHEQAAEHVAEVKGGQPLDKDALRGLSRDLLGKLRRAVTAARYDEIAELIETVRMTEPEVATGLRRMADLFDYDGLRELLGQGKEE